MRSFNAILPCRDCGGRGWVYEAIYDDEYDEIDGTLIYSEGPARYEEMDCWTCNGTGDALD